MIVLAGCGASGTDATDASATSTAPAARPARTQRPALCGRLTARVTGRVRSPAAQELSGLVLSRSQPKVLWTHNDSGAPPRVLAVAPDGRLRADLLVTGADSVDWEDIALGPAASGAGGGMLFLGDIGDNAEERSEIVVYGTPEPRLGPGVQRGATAAAQRLALRYPDGPHDAEALLVDGRTGALVIVTKTFEGTARVYAARRPSPNRTVTLRRTGRIALGGGEAVTAGDVSADGSTVVLRTYDRAFVFGRKRGEALTRTLRRRPCTAGAELAGEGQGEALALAADGRAFYTVPEDRNPAIRRYAPPD